MPRSAITGIVALLLALSSPVVAAPATGPAAAPSATTRPAATQPSATKPTVTRPGTQPVEPKLSSAEAKALEKKVLDLTRKSIDLLKKNKIAEAEPVLKEALLLDPSHITNLYNYACLLALKGKADDAVLYLERAADAGWVDFIHLDRDPDLNTLRALPAFKKFVGNKPLYQKRSAEKVIDTLRKQFGDSYLYELDAERKLIFATNTDRTTLGELKKWLTAQAGSQWQQLFEHKPDAYISVVVPSAADYKKIVRMPGVGGFYNDTAKILICQRMGQTMTHEFTHALHAGDKAPLGQDHPIWIVEGIASMFEAAQFEGDKLVPHDNFRLNMLQNANRGKKLIPLTTLLAMEQPEFVKKANLAYGQASSIMLYLYEKSLLRPFYDTYKKTFDKDASGKEALEAVTKQSLVEFEKTWTAWMMARTPVPNSTGGDGVVIGARLGDGNDGIKIEQIVPNGPAEKAGLKNGDVLVGIADAQVRDYQSFVPMLIQFKPGDEVMLKIRRDGKYLDLPLTLGKRSELLIPSGSPTSKPSTRPATSLLKIASPAATARMARSISACSARLSR